MIEMEKDDSIFVAGHRGLVGSAIVFELQKRGFTNIITVSRSELDLRKQDAVHSWFKKQKIDYVFMSAAKVGGILANSTYPAEFIYDNLMIQTNLIHSAHENHVKKFEFLGSSCIYPKFAPQPIDEKSLLTGLLEETNEPYAIAKIAGIKMCQYYQKQYGFNAISLMPTNLYGPNDNFHLKNSHVLPAFIRKFHEAKINDKPKVSIWGTGKPFREFLYIEDLSDATIFLMQNYSSSEIINVGTGKDISIYDLAVLIKDITGYDGELEFDLSKPDGTPKKLLNVEKLTELGWKPKFSLKQGIKKTYEWFVSNYSNIIEKEKS